MGITRAGHDAFSQTREPISEPDDWHCAPASSSRGVIREFPEESSRRSAKNCAAIPWGSFPSLFVTVTFHRFRRCGSGLLWESE